MKKGYKIPRYAYLYIGIVLVMQFITYYSPMLFKVTATHSPSPFNIDAHIPCIPGFVFIYVAAFVLWIAAYVYFIIRDKALGRRVVVTDVLCKIVCIACFYLYPCTLEQPEVLTGFGAWALKIVYACDEPMNLLPSMHCYMSWLCVRPLLSGMTPEIKRPYRIALYIFAVLICASTLFTKQHLFLDAVTGVLLTEVMWFLSGLMLKNRAV